MTYTAADMERAARALSKAQHFTSDEAPVLVGMKQVPVWVSRLSQVQVVIDALRDRDRSAEGGETGTGSTEGKSPGRDGIAQKEGS